jgi:hypothetical protein
MGVVRSESRFHLSMARRTQRASLLLFPQRYELFFHTSPLPVVVWTTDWSFSREPYELQRSPLSSPSSFAPMRVRLRVLEPWVSVA